MAGRSMRSQTYLASDALLPVDYHGLDTSRQLRSHAEEFQRAKGEIAVGKRRRRNSTKDTRNLDTISADGPDRRFKDIKIPDSGIRDGSAARFYMPAFPNVQDFTRRSARWEDEEQRSASQDEKSGQFSSRDSTYRDDSLASKMSDRSLAVNLPESASAESISTQAAVSEKRAPRQPSASGDPKAEEVFYRCYAKGCKYKHARRGNFSIHWKRDAKHAGTFDLKKVLHCSRSRVNGKITTTPYGQIKVYRQRQSSGPKDDTSATITHKHSPSRSKKRKAPAHEELSRQTQIRSTIVLAPASKTNLQGLDTITDDAPTKLARANNPNLYSALECQIFKSLKDVPANFPTHLTPLISHGGPSDCRYFCPECQKCFTQTHNVASHFSRAHGKTYSKKDRDRTVCCRTTAAPNRVNIDAKPIDETILPRLVQIPLQRARSTPPPPPPPASLAPAPDTDHDSLGDAPRSLRRDQTIPANFLLNTIEAVLPLPTLSFRTPLGLSHQAPPPRSSAERISRMQAVREAILRRIDAPARNTAGGSAGQPEHSTPAPTTDTQGSAPGDRHTQRDGGTGTTIPKHDTRDLVRQPSWHAVSQPAPGPESHKRKRLATDRNGEDPSSDGAGMPSGPSDTEDSDTKDAAGAGITQTTQTADPEMGDGMGPMEGSLQVADCGSQAEETGQDSGPDEQGDGGGVWRGPQKRRKMTLAEYTALRSGAGARSEKA